jgi:hypothetical protein
LKRRSRKKRPNGKFKNENAHVAEGKKTRTFQIGGATVEVVPVEITKRLREQPNEYELEDGAVIRVTNPTVVVYRLIGGAKDWKGSPGYYVENGTSVIVVQPPQEDEEPKH